MVTVLKMHHEGVMHVEIDCSSRYVYRKALFHAWPTHTEKQRHHSHLIYSSGEHAVVFMMIQPHTVKPMNEVRAIFCHMERKQVSQPVV